MDGPLDPVFLRSLEKITKLPSETMPLFSPASFLPNLVRIGLNQRKRAGGEAPWPPGGEELGSLDTVWVFVADRSGENFCVRKVMFKGYRSGNGDLLISARTGQGKPIQSAFSRDEIILDLQREPDCRNRGKRGPPMLHCHVSRSRRIRDGLAHLATRTVTSQRLFRHTSRIEVLNFAPEGPWLFRSLFARRRVLDPESLLHLGEMADRYLLFDHAETFLEETAYCPDVSPRLRALALQRLAFLAAEKGKSTALTFCRRALSTLKNTDAEGLYRELELLKTILTIQSGRTGEKRHARDSLASASEWDTANRLDQIRLLAMARFSPDPSRAEPGFQAMVKALLTLGEPKLRGDYLFCRLLGKSDGTPFTVLRDSIIENYKAVADLHRLGLFYAFLAGRNAAFPQRLAWAEKAAGFLGGADAFASITRGHRELLLHLVSRHCSETGDLKRQSEESFRLYKIIGYSGWEALNRILERKNRRSNRARWDPFFRLLREREAKKKLAPHR
jgi:hypothetical protein